VLTRNVLLFSLVAEGVTALAVMAAPGLVVRLLFGAELSGAGISVARLLAITLLTLVIACWPGATAPSGTRAARNAVIAYNLFAGLYLAYLGVAQRRAGILLWPAVSEHVLVASALLYLGFGNDGVRS
jgi:hypothetical protein